MVSRRKLMSVAAGSAIAGCVGTQTRSVTCSGPSVSGWTQFRGGASRNLFYNTSLLSEGEVRTDSVSLDVQLTAPAVFDADHIYLNSRKKVKSVNKDTGDTKWTISAENEFRTSPIRACDAVFISGTDNLYAMDSMTGQQRWRRRIDGALEVQRSPLYKNERVFLINNKLNAIDAESGDLLWEWDEGGKPTGLAAGDGFFITNEGRGQETTEGIVRLNPSNGEQLWKVEDVRWIRQPPVVHDGVVAVVSRTTGDIHLLRIENGTQIARVRRQVREPEIAPSPTLTDTGFIATTIGQEVSGTVSAYDLSGTKRWATETGFVEHPPLVLNNSVTVVNANDKLIILDRNTGDRLFSPQDLPGSVLRTTFAPAVLDDRVIFSTENSLIEISLV